MTWETIGDFLNRTASIAGSLTVIAAFVAAVAIKPYKCYRQKQEERKTIEAAKEKRMMTLMDDVASSIKTINEIKAIVEENGRMVLRHDEELLAIEKISLQRTRNALVEKGWALDAEKEAFYEQYETYTARGGNHGAGDYLQEVKRLPSRPPAKPPRKKPPPKTESNIVTA